MHGAWVTPSCLSLGLVLQPSEDPTDQLSGKIWRCCHFHTNIFRVLKCHRAQLQPPICQISRSKLLWDLFYSDWFLPSAPTYTALAQMQTPFMCCWKKEREKTQDLWLSVIPWRSYWCAPLPSCLSSWIILVICQRNSFVLFLFLNQKPSFLFHSYSSIHCQAPRTKSCNHYHQHSHGLMENKGLQMTILWWDWWWAVIGIYG